MPVGPDSELVGKSVKDTGLREKDIVILSIQRGGLVIPNPRNDRPILAGDVLVCYGLKAALQNLVPALAARRRPAKKTTAKKKPAKKVAAKKSPPTKKA